MSNVNDVLATLRRINPNEPGGEWSVWDISQALDIGEYEANDLLREACAQDEGIGARYVGGTSVYLYSL